MSKFIAALIFVAVVILASPAIAIWLVITFVVKFAVLVVIWLAWLPRGVDTLVVYSNSPHWQGYFKDSLLPAINSRARVLNWSDRKHWSYCSVSYLAFSTFTGTREFNPIVLVFKPFQSPTRFQFYRAFRDYSHNNLSTLRQLVDELAACLRQEVPMPSRSREHPPQSVSIRD